MRYSPLGLCAIWAKSQKLKFGTFTVVNHSHTHKNLSSLAQNLANLQVLAFQLGIVPPLDTIKPKM